MSVIAILNAVILLTTVIARKRRTRFNEETDAENNEKSSDSDTNETEYDTLKQRRRFVTLKIIALLAGIIPLILFLLLENIRLPLVWITQWTPIIGAFFIIHMIILLVQIVVKERVRNKNEDEDENDITANELAPLTENA